MIQERKSWQETEQQVAGAGSCWWRFNCTHEAVSEVEKEKAINFQIPPPVAHLLKALQPPQIAKLLKSVQIPEPMGLFLTQITIRI